MRRLSFALPAILLLAACSSSGILGDLGGILGSPSSSQPSDVTGTVDSRTRVQYGNQTYNVADLERGDQVSVLGVNDDLRR
jgi:hypothetical protein